MLSSFYFRCFQPLIVLALGAGFLIPIHPALSLTNKQAQAFRREYMKGCLEGVSQSGLDPTKGEKYCRCTLNNLLRLPDEKLRSLGRLTEQQIMQDAAIQNAISSCLSTYTKPRQ
ncbi:conserved exported hypothetical protein [Planktothrix serta PCC 8927]|uniref:Uncharacterized protein n=1 Tax=Planktothrix serta PCC 8927 TaxID=671068 RepID=A0A7Z9BMV1_9CYAN|nr:hypothetical protein [Planktothrix serta]VXD12348.1 conserved exported hypothetical protein [Planktothrix serta PCC 8927]